MKKLIKLIIGLTLALSGIFLFIYIQNDYPVLNESYLIQFFGVTLYIVSVLLLGYGGFLIWWFFNDNI